MITYTTSLDGIMPDHLRGGLFEGWGKPPSAETHLRMLSAAYRVVLARDGEQVVGFINAISDGVLSAFIPLLEVLPAYRDQGIGRELVQRMIAELHPIYMIDLICDEALVPYYEKLGMIAVRGMVVRNYPSQAGLAESSDTLKVKS